MRIARLFAVLAVMTVGLTALRLPAGAHTDECASNGDFTLSTPFVSPASGSAQSAGFNMSFWNAVCSSGSNSLSAYGSVSGFCALASGTGVMNAHPFTFQWVGNLLIFSGDVQGVFRLQDGAMPVSTTCLTGASQFNVVGAVRFVHGVPPVPTIPTSIPPLAGGPPGPSTGCTSNLLLDTTIQGVHGKVLVQQTSSTETWVCIRAENGTQGLGGRLELVSATPGTPGVTLPTTDSDGDACWTTAGNSIPGTHPALKVDVPVHFYVDAYRSGNQTWICIESGTSGTRVLLTDPTVGGGGIPSVRWLPDPGTPG